MVPRHDEERTVEAAEEARGGLVLSGAAEVGEVAGRDHELGLDALDERHDGGSGGEIVLRPPRADVEVRHVEDACMHRRRRLQ
jgi:hypothetical protein